MKPTTKLEKYVCQLAGTLKPISEKHLAAAAEHCFYHIAYRNKNTLHCSECGMSWKSKDLRHKTAVCPHCGKSLFVEDCKRRKFPSIGILCVSLRKKEFQVFRFFWVTKHYKQNEKPTFDCLEIIQHWCSAEGKKVVLARNKKPMSSYFFNPWDYCSALSVKKCKGYSYDYDYYYSPSYTISQSILPILKRNGFRGNTHGEIPYLCIKKLNESCRHETLFKARQYAAFRYFSADSIKDYWASIKIAIRNKYIIKDASAWRDLVDSLQACGMDVRNPKYICPTDLKTAHDYWCKRAEKIREKARLKKQYEQALLEEKDFLENKRRFFGIILNAKGISIHVLSSIKEYLEEGTCMHHCVFSNKYYSKKNSLILSATDCNDNRLATIELSLEDFSIVQCRAAFNAIPPLKDKINSIIMKNIKLFKTAAA